MRKFKSFAGILLVLVMIFAMTSMAFAYTGNYTITIGSVSGYGRIDGNTYEAYKLFNATYSEVEWNSSGGRAMSAYSYTIAKEFAGDAENSVVPFEFNGKSGKDLIAYVGTLEDNAEELDALANAAFMYAKEHNIKPKGSVTAPDDAWQATINLAEPGYYIVAGSLTTYNDQTVVASCALTTTDPSASVVVKAAPPKIEKDFFEGVVKPGDYDTSELKCAAIGDKLEYVVRATVPETRGYSKYFYVITDTLSKGLSYNNDMRIQFCWPESRYFEDLTEGEHYTVSSVINDDGTTTLKIVFKDFIDFLKQPGRDGNQFHIFYSATLNEHAVINGSGNPNSVRLTYSTNPHVTPISKTDEPAPGDPVGVTPEAVVIALTTAVTLNKVDNSTPAKPLSGAQFKITGEKLNTVVVDGYSFEPADNGEYYKLKNGTYTNTAPTTEGSGNNVAAYDDITKTYNKVADPVLVAKDTTPIEAVAFVNDDGRLVFSGLNVGTYYIKEIIAPDGYNLLEETIKLDVDFVIDDDCEVDPPYDSFFNSCWSYTWNNVPGTADYTVVNQAGTELPSTGGIGTTIFYIVGAVLAIGAGVVLIAKRRMENDK